MGETIMVKAKRKKDADGRIIRLGDDRLIHDCVVTPQGKIDVYTDEISGGNILEMQVSFPAGYPPVEDDATVVIRGMEYKTKFPSWDFFPGRQPWLQLHQPHQVMIVEKVEA